MSILQTPVLGHEIELKLQMDSASMAQLKRLPLLAANRQTKPRSVNLMSIYWDTPQLELATQGITLRIRAEGRKRIQTVKTAGIRGAALQDRQEWEWPILSDHPNMHLLETTGLAPLGDATVLGRLVPVYTTEFRRTLHRLATDEWAIEVAMDEGKVATRDAEDPICEVELELYGGSAAVLVDLAKDIASAVPARLLNVTKSERGQRLLTGWKPVPTKSSPAELTTVMNVGQAFQAIGRNCINQMLANEHCLMLNGSPEAIHQMRVALRRLRSAIKLFRPLLTGPQTESVRTELRWLQASLGPARDTHVFLQEIIAPVQAQYPQMAPMQALRDHWAQENAVHVKAAMATVAQTRFTLMMLLLVGWIEAGEWQTEDACQEQINRPITDFARQTLAKQDRRLRRAATDDPTQLPMEELHNLRILGKQVRYTEEFFAGLFAKKIVRPHLLALADLQEVLGQVHDIAIAAERLEQTSDTHPGDSSRAWAAGLVAGWHAGRLPMLLSQVDNVWENYCAAPRYWKE